MPEIKVKITQGSTEVSSKSTDIPSNTMPDLLASLKAAKEATNTVLTALVESSKDQKQTRKTTQDDEDDDSSSEDDDDSARKKPKP